MTFREFECALGWEIAGRYNEEIHSALLRPPIAVWREHEASLALRMPKDRMAFWVSFLPTPIAKTALTQRKLIDEAIAKTAAARRAPVKTKNGDEADFGSMSGIDSRIPTVLELVERQRDRNSRPSDG